MSFVCDTKKRKIKAEMCSMNWGGGNLSGTKGVERQQEAHMRNEGCHWEGVGRISWVFSNVSEQRRETNIKKERNKNREMCPSPTFSGSAPLSASASEVLYAKTCRTRGEVATANPSAVGLIARSS